MISRRTALKLGTTGLLAPLSGSQFADTATPVATDQVPSSNSPSLDAPLIVKWRYDTGTERNGPPLLVENTAYGVIPGTAVFALDAQTGLEVWYSLLPAGRYTPVLANDLLIVGTASGGLAALSPADGTETWRIEGDAEMAQPIFSGATIFTGVASGALLALDADTGTEIWRFYGPQFDTFFSTPAVVGDDTVFVSAGTPILYAIDTITGSQKWQFATDGYRLGSPVLWNEFVYVTSSNGVHALSADTGEQVWLFEAEGSPGASPLVDESYVFAPFDNGFLCALDRLTGKPIWTADPIQEYQYGASSLEGDATSLVFMRTFGGGARPYFDTICVDKSTGEMKWKTEDTGSYSEYVVNPDGTTLIGEWHGKALEVDHPLYLVETETGREIWRWQAYGGFTTPPIVHAGNYYLAGGLGMLLCLGNLAPAVLVADVTIHGAPSPDAVQRGAASTGDSVQGIGSRDARSGQEWVEVTINGVTGWIPLSAIDPATIPPEGDVEYVYTPE